MNENWMQVKRKLTSCSVWEWKIQDIWNTIGIEYSFQNQNNKTPRTTGYNSQNRCQLKNNLTWRHPKLCFKNNLSVAFIENECIHILNKSFWRNDKTI